MEHRWGERITLDCPARLELPGGAIAAGCVRNASISGALIDTATRAPVNSAIVVLLPAGDTAQARTLELPACVVRNTQDGFAVEWRDMATPTLLALLREVGGDTARICTRC